MRKRPPKPCTPFLLAGLLVTVLGSCLSPEEYREQADRQVYEIVRQRREELAATDAFTIDRPVDPLRDQLLEGSVELEPLDLLECLDIGAENSRQYQTQREALYLTALDLTLEQWNFSVQETGTFGAFLEGTGTEADRQGFLSDLGLSKLFGTGLAIIGNIGLDLVRDVGRGDGFDAISNLSLNITQPILRGYGREIVEEPLTQAEYDVLYQARAYERFRRTFAFDVATRFFNIVQAQDTLRNEELNYERTKLLRERNEAFAEAGQLNDIEVDRARQDELEAENSIIAARRSLEAQLDDLKLFLGLPIESPLEIDRGDFTDLDTWADLLELDFDEDTVIDIALTERLDYQTSLDQVIDAERKVVVAADALRAGLDLSGSGLALSEEGKPLDFRRENFTWDLDIEFDAPIDRLPERNAYRASLIAFDVADRNAVQDADSIINDVRDDLRNLQASRESYEIQLDTVTLNERRAESANLQLDAGRVETIDVTDAQRDLVNAQNALAQALTNYILSGISLYLDMELIRVTEDGITVERGPLEERMEGKLP